MSETGELEKDKARLDWLADPENQIGNVQLPTGAVMGNLHSLRAAIDAAMSGDFEARDVDSNTEPCECRDWCRDGQDRFSVHHPRCQHYVPPTPDPRMAKFGERVWRIIKENPEACSEEFVWDHIMPNAEAVGLCEHVEYDPETHGEGIDAEPGSNIWWWGNDSANENRPVNSADGRLSSSASFAISGTELDVCRDIESRQQMGIEKYGMTVATNPAHLLEWLQHAYEESLDKAIYLKRAIAELGSANR